jgi:hypothetical protein
MTLHLRTQDERFCGSRKNFRNPLLVVGLGSAVKAPSEAASPAQVVGVYGSVDCFDKRKGTGRLAQLAVVSCVSCARQPRPTYSSGCG